jgi:hypothetical protein
MNEVADARALRSRSSFEKIIGPAHAARLALPMVMASGLLSVAAVQHDEGTECIRAV